MTIQEARIKLNDTSFLSGSFKRTAALKELSEIDDPLAAEVLVSAVDLGNPSLDKIREVLLANKRQTWADRMWEIWASKRQPWLLETLRKRGCVFSMADSNLGVLSRMAIGGQTLPADAQTASQVVKFLSDPDNKIQNIARQYFDILQKKAPNVWMACLLRARLFNIIGNARVVIELLSTFLNNSDPALSNSARQCVSNLPVSDRVLALLLAGKDSELPMDRQTAFVVADIRTNGDGTTENSAKAYLGRAMASETDFVMALAFKSGYANKVAVNALAVAEALRLVRDRDPDVSAAARTWLSSLPRDQRYHDAIVDDWLRSDDAFLCKLLCDGNRFPSDPGREALLRLLWGDAKGYLAMEDPDGTYFAEALTAANETRRAVIVRTVQNSRDATLADRFRRASLKVQGMDSGLALKALQASGDEDRLVDATREMTGAELFEQCRRWAESGRRPTDPRRREAVERAVALLRDQPKIEIEPAPALPTGTEDLIAVWAGDKRPEQELRAELKADDPFVRAGALYTLANRGLIDGATLAQKQKSEQWAERFAATLAGAPGDVSQDHVCWVAQCAGVDEELYKEKVACGPDIFEASSERLAKLRKAKTPLATRAANELEVLQIFRALLSRGELVVSADDSANVKGAVQDGGVATW